MATRRAQWFRVVAVADFSTRWEPLWRLRMNGTGPLLAVSFRNVWDAVAYVQEEYPKSYIEVPALELEIG